MQRRNGLDSAPGTCGRCFTPWLRLFRVGDLGGVAIRRAAGGGALLGSRSPEAFLELLHQEGVTVLNQTPSAFRQLIQADLGAEPRGVRVAVVIFGGEALALRSLRPWFERYGDAAALVNMYGITETCVHVTYRPISLRDLEEQREVVIGVPIPDLRVYVLDGPNTSRCRWGCRGSCTSEVPGLARGYLNRIGTDGASGSSQIRFAPAGAAVPDGGPGALAGGGELEYLGRIDQPGENPGFPSRVGGDRVGVWGNTRR